MKETSHLTSLCLLFVCTYVRATFVFKQAKSSVCCLITELFCATTNVSVVRMGGKKDQISGVFFKVTSFILIVCVSPSVLPLFLPVWACLSVCVQM